MSRVLVRCDGAGLPDDPASESWDRRETLTSQGPATDLDLRLQNLQRAILSQVSDRAADLTRIAAYVYASDQLVSRGGAADLLGKHWRHLFHLCVPVTDPDFWSGSAVLEALVTALHFASDHTWQFSFTHAGPEYGQLPLNAEVTELYGHPDLVVLLSGGADSLCATVEAVANGGARPVLVSHTSSPYAHRKQMDVAIALRKAFAGVWDFPHVGAWVHRRGTDANETSQRTRSVLFAATGAAVAATLGVPRVLLADSGVVSLNLPINDQLFGATATRSTHPRLLWLLNRLLALVFPEGPRLENPLWDRTRPEVLEILRRSEVPELFAATVSCAHPRRPNARTAHCAVCSQCLDRRLAALATGLEPQDARDLYDLDVLIDDIPNGRPLVMAHSYLRFARQMARVTDEVLELDFPQFFDAILPDDPLPLDTGGRLRDMLKRHGSTVQRVISDQVGVHRARLAASDLPSTCLLRLAIDGETLAAVSLERPADLPFDHSPDYRWVKVRGHQYSLTERQAEVFEVLHRHHPKPVREALVASELDLPPSSNIKNVFRGSPVLDSVVLRDRRGTYWLALEPEAAHPALAH